MRLDTKIVADLAIAFRPQSFLRVMPAAHMATPLGMGFGQSRFSSPNRLFKLLYIAQDLATAVAETIIRDRFEGEQERVLDESEIAESAVAEVTAAEALIVLDLRTTGLLRLGVSTDAARAKPHLEGQKLSEAVHSGFAVDGLLYSSRLTGAHCVAVYDRAVERKLRSSSSSELIRQGNLVSALESLSVSVRAGR